MKDHYIDISVEINPNSKKGEIVLPFSDLEERIEEVKKCSIFTVKNVPVYRDPKLEEKVVRFILNSFEIERLKQEVKLIKGQIFVF